MHRWIGITHLATAHQSFKAALFLVLPLLASLLVPPAFARPPEVADLSQSPTARPSEALGGQSTDTYTSIYFENFECGTGGWVSRNMPGPPPPVPTYWNRLDEGAHYATGFEAPRYSPGPLSPGNDGWGPDGLVSIQGAVVATGSHALMIDRSDGSSGTNVNRAVDLDVTDQTVTVKTAVNLSAGDISQLSYWTVLHVGLSQNWLDVNVEPAGEIVVVTEGPVPHYTGQVITRSAWTHFELRLDFSARIATLLYNGAQIYTGAIPGVSTYFVNASFGGQFPGATDVGYFDDFSITLPGAWWCGSTDACALNTPPGYGNSWDQRLEKSFGPLPVGANLDFTHQYDVEWNCDFCYVEASTDGGANYQILATFSGNPPSKGFINSSIDLSAYAGQPVLISFHFVSDIGWSDEDEFIDSDGAWRIARVQVTESERDDFEAGGDGWNAFGVPHSAWNAVFRLEDSPICNLGDCTSDFGSSWVAYDPATGEVPIFPENIAVEAGILSPEITIPSDYDRLLLDISAYTNLPYSNLLFHKWQIVSTAPNGCTQTSTNNWVYSGTSGWRCKRHDPPTEDGLFDITDHVAEGATSIQIQLSLVDIRIHGSQLNPPVIWSGQHTEGVYYDNVHLIAVNTTATGIPTPDACVTQTPCHVTVSGQISAACDGAVAGVTVDLNHPDGTMLSASTDDQGMYIFNEVPGSSADGVVAIVTPLGYDAAIPEDGQATLSFTEDQVANFTLTCLEPNGSARSMGYWKHQANVHINQKGHAHESYEDMSENYPAAIFGHFHQRTLDRIVVDGVTYMDDGSGGHTQLNLQYVHATLTVNKNGTMDDRARQQYLALLLNVASGKLLTSRVISADGATASQALQQAAALINLGGQENLELAKNISDMINNATLVPAGVIDLALEQIAYRRGAGRLFTLQISPAPFRRSTSIQFQLEKSGHARVDIFDAAGRVVRRLHNGWTPAGEKRLTWRGVADDGHTLPAGVYYVRLSKEDNVFSRSVVLLK